MKFSLGRYVPYNSLIHRIDPRAKLLSILLLMICIFFPYQSWAMTFAVNGAVFLLLVVLLYMTRTKIIDVLRSLKSLWFMVIFLLLIYCLIPTNEPTFPLAFEIAAWNWRVYWDSFLQAAKILLRLMMMIELTMVLTSSTKPLDLTYALEWYMTPLKAIHFPAHEIAMTISIAIRFIPTLLEDTSRIMKSQESRGVSFSHGRITKRVVSLTSLIIPLFVSAFMRSDELANAMECRGYDPRGKRTRYRMLKAKWYDFAFLLFCMAVFGVLLWFAIDPRFNALLKFPPEI